MAPQVFSVDSIELAQAPAGDSIGRVDNVTGSVFVTRADGARVEGATGTPLFQGDSIETGAGAKLGIVFADDTTFAMGEKGKMVLDEMVYDPGSQTGKAAITVAEGLFSFVSGQLAKTGPEAMTITTPVAVIGIRGTAGAGKAAPEGTPNTFTLLPDPGGTTTGEVSMRTQLGVQVLNKPFQATQITSAFSLPPPPITLPPSVVARVFGAVTAALPPSPSGPATGQTGGPTGPALPGGPAGPAGLAAPGTPGAEAGALAPGAPPPGALPPGGIEGVAADAAARAFDAAIAGGLSLDAAFTNAFNTATTVAIQTAFAQAPTPGFGGPAGGIATAFATLTQTFNQAFGQGPDGPPVGGPGSENFGFGFSPELGFLQGLGLAPEGFGLGFGPDPGRDFDTFFNEFAVREFTDFFLGGGTEGVFQEFLVATTGNDDLRGGNQNTQFQMTQNATLGGTDTVDGGGGTDEITLTNLSHFQAILDASAKTIRYANSADTVNGTINLISIEQIFADDSTGTDRQRLAFDSADTSGFGYLVAGTSGDDTLSLAPGGSGASELAFGALNGSAGSDIDAADDNIGNTGYFLGSLIFGGAGNDTITGTPGEDILKGGDGNDVLTGGNGNDALFGGAGNDTLIAVNATDIADGGSFQGEGGTDILQVGTGTAATPAMPTFNFVSAANTVGLSGFEMMTIFKSDTTVAAGSSFLGALGSIARVSGETPTGVTIEGGQSATLDLTSVDLGVANFITTLKINSASVGSGVTISDNGSDTVGRTLVGSTGADKLFGVDGGDTYQLGSDSAADAVYYRNTTDGAAAGDVTAYDSINDFVSGTDKIKFVTNSTTLSTFDDVTVNNTAAVASAAQNGADLSTAEVVRITTTVANGDLIASGFANVIAAIGTVTAGTATAADAQNDAIFIVNGSSKAGIYLYTNADGAGANNTTVESGELTLLGVVENTQITNNSDVEFATAVHG